MELFLKEYPEKKDIDDLEKLVTEINERLNRHFPETFESVAQALKVRGNRQHLMTKLSIAPDILTIYLDEAKKRHALVQIANDEASRNDESTGNTISTSNNTSLANPAGTADSSEALANLYKIIEDQSSDGINNPVFIDDSEPLPETTQGAANWPQQSRKIKGLQPCAAIQLYRYVPR